MVSRPAPCRPPTPACWSNSPRRRRQGSETAIWRELASRLLVVPRTNFSRTKLGERGLRNVPQPSFLLTLMHRRLRREMRCCDGLGGYYREPMRRHAALTFLLAAGCSPEAASPPPPPATTAGVDGHDFGVIPHGEVRKHTFELEVPGGTAGKTALGFRSGCTCGSARFMVRRSDGELQEIDSLSMGARQLEAGDQLLLELTIDTRREEAVDRPTTTIRGSAIVQAGDAGARTDLPVVYHYAIDAPVDILPAAHVDFGALPRSKTYAQSLRLEVDDDFAPIEFEGISTTNPDLRAKLRPENGSVLVDLEYTAHANASLGPVRMEIHVATDMANDYVVAIPVSGSLTSDITVEPFAHMSFGRFDFSTPREQFVNVIDHRTDRSAEFVLVDVTDAEGLPMAKHFEVRLEPLEGSPRCTRMFLRYLGSWEQPSFRGVVRLAKPDGTPGPEITFVGFHKES